MFLCSCRVGGLVPLCSCGVVGLVPLRSCGVVGRGYAFKVSVVVVFCCFLQVAFSFAVLDFSLSCFCCCVTF